MIYLFGVGYGVMTKAADNMGGGKSESESGKERKERVMDTTIVLRLYFITMAMHRLNVITISAAYSLLP